MNGGLRGKKGRSLRGKKEEEGFPFALGSVISPVPTGRLLAGAVPKVLSTSRLRHCAAVFATSVVIAAVTVHLSALLSRFGFESGIFSPPPPPLERLRRMIGAAMSQNFEIAVVLQASAGPRGTLYRERNCSEKASG